MPQRAGVTGPGLYPVAGQGGALRVVAAGEGGVTPASVRLAQWRARKGGERFQRAPGTPPRSLKKQFQAAGVPAWQRDAPLLFDADGRLLFVPGLGIDARARAAAGEPQFALSWVRQP
jgi:tRNA(Ile)-lysidine synthase